MKLEYVISTICRDSIKARTIECIENTRWSLAAEGITFYWNTPHGDGKARARSITASRFLEQTPEANYLLFIDSDILFRPQHVKRIFEDMRDGYDLIGGLFAVRGGTQASSYGIEGKLMLDGNIHEFEYIATGFMGVTRKLLLKIRDEIPLPLLHPHDIKFWPFFEERQYPDREGEGIFLSEDYDFCEKARKVGTKPYIDTSVQLGHLGEYSYSLNDVVTLQKENKAKEIVENQVRLKHLVRDLAEFTSQDKGQVDRKLEYARMTLARLWREHKGTPEEFYKDNVECLYDDATFNLGADYAKNKLASLSNIKGEKILDIGCGIGTAAFMLASQGNKVIGYDINQTAIDFCNFKKKRNKASITFTTDMPELSQFNLIVCIDVLEHIEDLESFIKMLGEGMKPGSRLYHNEPIKEELYIETHHPQHFDHTDKVETYLEEAGFSLKGDVWAIKK